MTKQEALEKTSRKFTNLMDGKVIPNVGVRTIVDYYESLLANNPIQIKSTSGIEANFIEDMATQYEEDYCDNIINF